MKRAGARPDTWMPLYVADYLADTTNLTTEGHGAYLLLIMTYWKGQQPLPDNDDELAPISRLPMPRWKKLRPIIARFFQVADGLWRHKRIDIEIKTAREMIDARSRAGKTAVEAREAKKQSMIDAMPSDASIASNDHPIDPPNDHRYDDPIDDRPDIQTIKPTISPSPERPSPSSEPKGSSEEAPSGASPPKRAARLPADWQPSDANRNYAIANMLTDAQIAKEVQKFRNYWVAKAGRDAAKLDWDAVWRNWILTAAERLPIKAGATDDAYRGVEI